MTTTESVHNITFIPQEREETMTTRVKATDLRHARNRICNRYGNRCDFSPFNRQPKTGEPIW